jgi:hypothetical protein
MMMPTNRTKRARHRRIPGIISTQYLEELRAKDFLGELSADEIPVAKAHGIYCWDDFMKNERRI